MNKRVVLILAIIAVPLIIVGLTIGFLFSFDRSGITVKNEKISLYMKNIAKKVKGIIYNEATKHNPEGDLLPDELDDKALGKIKEFIN